jgi:hypothetical protein
MSKGRGRGAASRIERHNRGIAPALPSLFFGRVDAGADNGHKVLAHISGKMRMHYIRILPDDRVSWS